MTRSIVLFGMMGVGKSTVARLVGQRLGREVVDTDAQIEARAGAGIPTIFAERGEQAFRELERAAVAEATARDRVVIALGGGAVLDEGNVERARAAGVLVRLEAAPEVLVERLTGEVRQTQRRPLLDDADPAAALARTLDERAARYEAVADVTVDASGPAETVADAVIAAAGARDDVLSAAERRSVAS